MCGIVGIVTLKAEPQARELERMTEKLKHRGPDHGETKAFAFTNHWVGMGHRRLSVIDLSAQANQPMAYEELTIVFNGEIYNFKAIRKTLETLGHVFNTSSDTEVLLHAFKAWGKDMVHQLNGMFALALFDRKNQRLYLMRDRFGVKPLCYFHHKELFLFSSESKAFHEHPGFDKKMNFTALARYFQYGNIPAPDSIYEFVTHVLPGTIVELDTQNLTLNTTTYWSPISAYQQPTLQMSFEEAKMETKQLLEASVTKRMISDVPFGLFLSGGYDSSTTAALLVPHVPNLKTFTVSVPDIGLNEGPKARAIAHRLGTDHLEIDCTVQEALDIIPKLPQLYDEPFADSSAIPTYLVAREAVKSVKVALSADGGDELFAGYNRYLYAYRIPNWLKHLPRTLQRAFGNALLQSPVGTGLQAQRLQKVGRWLKDASIENYMEVMTKLTSDQETLCFFKVPIRYTESSTPQAASPLGQMLLLDTLNYLPNDILHKVDRATMAVGLEGREPLLDVDLLTFLAQLPDHYKCNRNESKIILKSLAHELLPPALLEGPKKGFAIPIAAWMKTHLRSAILEMVDSTFLNQQNIFDVEKVQQEVYGFLNGKKPNGLFTWYFYNFQLWYKQWMQ
ncbi:MAG: asparagine synthase (glutamine-hydrolyzing) [Flavobacteriales bacterium]